MTPQLRVTGPHHLEIIAFLVTIYFESDKPQIAIEGEKANGNLNMQTTVSTRTNLRSEVLLILFI